MRASVLAAVAPDHAVPAARLAEFHGVPPAYLAKVLQALARAGIVESVAGRRGGYRLARPAADITLLEAALPGAWDENDRIRREGSRNLVDAAIAAGAERYVQESICFIYADAGARWIDESSPTDVPPWVAAAVEAEGQAERFTAAGGAGVALRFGQFYAPDSSHTLDLVRAARKGLAAVIGAPEAYAANVHADDAAAAVVAALAAPAGIYNVVDDEPVTRRDLRSILAGAVGRRRRVTPPTTAVRIASRKSELLARSQRVSNRLMRDATGWAPRYPSVREGLPAVVAALGHDRPGR